MGRVRSRDGTTIAFERLGKGPALILVDGALCHRAFFGMGPEAEILATRFTVFTYDRRGRGESDDTPLLQPVDAGGESIRQALQLEPNAPLAIYVGSVTINRGIEVCVRALAHYPELHFATVGPRRKQNEIELLEIARAEGVSERFHLVDPVAEDAVVGFIRDADVSVLPIQNVCLSYYYCMPNKLFESVFSGLPVVVADLVELRRFVERYPCGVVMDETDPRDAARAIRAVAESRDRYILGADQLAEVRGTYSWPAQAGMLLEAYGRMTLAKAASSR
jgi:glycosyltransferase involved in cell wall biosynthesis